MYLENGEGLIAFVSASLTVDATSGGVPIASASTHSTGYGQPAEKVFMTLETAQIRFTVDSTAPTATIGHLLEVGQNLTLSGPQEIKAFRAFRTGTTSGALYITSWCRGGK